MQHTLTRHGPLAKKTVKYTCSCISKAALALVASGGYHFSSDTGRIQFACSADPARTAFFKRSARFLQGWPQQQQPSSLTRRLPSSPIRTLLPHLVLSQRGGLLPTGLRRIHEMIIFSSQGIGLWPAVIGVRLQLALNCGGAIL